MIKSVLVMLIISEYLSKNNKQVCGYIILKHETGLWDPEEIRSVHLVADTSSMQQGDKIDSWRCVLLGTKWG